MNRLTSEEGQLYACGYGRCNDEINCTCGDCHYTEEAFKKLAAYEDTGLQPEQIKKMFEYHTNRDLYDYITELLDLDDEGRLIKLPCKVGDIFYINIQKQTYECKISGFYISKDEIQFMVAFQDEDSKTWHETGEAHKKEDLFLTREEAEKALEGVEK